MSRAPWKLVLGVVAATAAATVTACSAPSDEHQIVVYNSHDQRLTQQWADTFTAETGIRVTLRNETDDDLTEQVLAEGEHSPADVVLTQNSPAMAKLERAGMFANLDPATLARVSENFRPASGSWTGIAARATVFASDPQHAPPVSLLDLQQPQWHRQWTVDTDSPDFHALTAALLELDGADVTRTWLRGVHNNATPASDGIAALKSAGAGKTAGALISATDWYRDHLAPEPIGGPTVPHYFRAQDPGAYLGLAGAGVLKASGHQADAQRFVAFLTGEVQHLLGGDAAMEYPVVAGVPADPALPPLDSLGAPRVDPSRLDSDAVDALMGEAGLD
ncbi:putative ABC-type Fe(3+) transport system, periplasmic component [Nocardia nova SH22a]|uniref:Putative ABC-type Fe(3+) transport system, periplasmic component n=1 Tax=Nocardia nova SH22a TaxID=1415166 RepID=W5TAL7_9NOCA|nr:extracellular solute-binding protein [Nocardia nova]AHH16028.1 putative ABC-type Fe(3+) transport system, periplasmic component [Nocardia nova SH22a]